MAQQAAHAVQAAVRDALAQVSPELALAAGALIAAMAVLYVLFDTLAYAAIPSLEVPLTAQELADKLDAPLYTPPKALPKDKIPCYDPGTMQLLGHAKAMTPEEVRGRGRARERVQRVLRAARCAACLRSPRRPCGQTAPAPSLRTPRPAAPRFLPGARRHRQGARGVQGAGGGATPPRTPRAAAPASAPPATRRAAAPHAPTAAAAAARSGAPPASRSAASC